MKKVLIPLAALLAAGLIGAVSAVGLWEAVGGDDGQPASAVSLPALTQNTASTTNAIAAVYERTAPGVVKLTVTTNGSDSSGNNPFGSPAPSGATGSGFVIDEQGHIVTNYHVVEGADEADVTFANGDEGHAQVVGTDPSSDLALLKLDDYDGDLTPLQLGSSEGLEVGDPVVAIGSPFGLEGTLTSGVVSQLDRRIQAPNGFTIDGAIQTDAALNSGNSGGPLIDMQGRVIGVASQIQSENGGNIGIGYAVPVETVKKVVDQLLAGGQVQHAYMGVQLQDDGNQVVLAEVVDGGPAADAGLQQGDVVVQVDGQAVESSEDVSGAVSAKEPGETISVQVERDGNTRTVEVKLGTRPATVQ
jgi:putative serine protease PepD